MTNQFGKRTNDRNGKASGREGGETMSLQFILLCEKNMSESADVCFLLRFMYCNRTKLSGARDTPNGEMFRLRKCIYSFHFLLHSFFYDNSIFAQNPVKQQAIASGQCRLPWMLLFSSLVSLSDSLDVRCASDLCAISKQNAHFKINRFTFEWLAISAFSALQTYTKIRIVILALCAQKTKK